LPRDTAARFCYGRSQEQVMAGAAPVPNHVELRPDRRAVPLSPSTLAGALVFASRHFEALGLPHPTHAQILAATGAGSTRAYAQAQAV
jgi:hypothetical protein